MPSKTQKTKQVIGKTAILAKPGLTHRSSSRPGSENNSRCGTPSSGSGSISVPRSSTRVKDKLKPRQLSSHSQKFYDRDRKIDDDDEYFYGSDLEFVSDGEFCDDGAHTDESDGYFEEFQTGYVSDDLSDANDDYNFTSFSANQADRPVTPEFIPENEVPSLILPSSCTDLPVTTSDLMQVVGVYEVLRQYSLLLRLAPFRFEDLCAAVTSDEQNMLISEVFISLLKAVLRDEEGKQAWFGPPETKDSVNVMFHFLDSMSWYECLKAFLESDPTWSEKEHIKAALSRESFFGMSLGDRLALLQHLCDMFLASNAFREDLVWEGNIRHEEHCRYCQK